jgi:tetratricopeptide (TPR) repeat protein
MDLVHGHSLRDYAEEHGLSTRQRLELIVKICEAVQHAHQRGLIHRDLKPGNILVDETGQPKILDFGVARVTDGDAQATRHTDLGQLVGTLAYMSPEQALGDPLELDTRSDVYALGVILYELLAGRLPYDLNRKPHEAARTIQEEDPTPLSSISRVYRGDIETIVAKALEKDKTRRYASASGLAADIQRYLKDEPIAARPPSASYQLRKFGRRHRALVAGVSAVFVVLVSGIIASTWEATRARRAEQSAEAVNDFLRHDLLAQASATMQARPDTKPDRDLKVRTALDRAAAQIEGKFKGQPLVEASIRQTIGATYEDLGIHLEAQRQIERALDLQRGLLGEADPKTLETMNLLVDLFLHEGKYTEAEPLAAKVVETQRRVLGEKHTSTLNSMNNLALLYRYQGKYAQAEPLYVRVLELQRAVLGAEHLDTLASLNNLATLYLTEGKYPQAEPLNIKVLELDRRVLGEEHPNTLAAMHNLAELYRREGKYTQAEPLFIKAVEVRSRVLGEEHPDALLSMGNLAVLYAYQGKYKQAQPLLAKVLEARRRVLGQEHPDTLDALNDLGVLYEKEGDYSQAEPLLTKALELKRHVLGEEHPATLLTMNGLAQLYLDQGKRQQAESLFGRVLGVRRRVLGPQNPDTITTLISLGEIRLQQQRYGDAEPLLREALTSYEKSTPAHWRRYNSESLLGTSLAGQKRYSEAEPLLVSGYRGMLQREATIPAFNRIELAQAGKSIVQFYQAWQKPDQAARWQQELHKKSSLSNSAANE